MKTSKVIIFTFLLILCSCSEKHDNPLIQNLVEGWILTTDTLNIKLNVEVPSVVQADLYDNKLIPNPYLGNVEPDLQWIPQHEWEYNLDFCVHDNIFKENVVEIVFEGLDTYADVWLNDILLFHADNMFRTWTENVKDILKKNNNHLKIRFYPFDKERDSLIKTYPLRFPEKYAVMRKAAYQNGWDWAPRYLNVGIWQPVYLKAWTYYTIKSASITTANLADNKADMCLDINIKSEIKHNIKLKLFMQETELLDKNLELNIGDNNFSFFFTVENPNLWWPNEMGKQNLYLFNLKMIDSKELIEQRDIITGIRKIELIQEPDSIGTAFYFKINNVPVYIKGANYIPEEMITSWMSSEKTRNLLEKCIGNAYMNMLRVWGGGIYPPDYFYDICDSLGLMVWQDFMFAGSTYPYSDEFIKNVRQEAVKHIVKYKNHPSLALWCGNNEISEGYYNWDWQKSMNWSENDNKEMKAGYDRLFEYMLKELVDEYDGTRPYWPSSPLKGWGRPESLMEGDVHYWGVWWGEEPYEKYKEKVGRFNSEFGYQSYPSMSTLRKIDKSADFDNAVIQAHQKHVRGEQLIKNQVIKYYPSPVDFEDYVYLSQLSQAYGMEMAILAQRCSRPRSMGSLYWQLNDAWPSISWSSIDYYGNKKAFHYKLNEIYSPILIGITNIGNDYYKLWSCNDLQRDINGCITILVKDMRGNVMYSFSENINLKANTCYYYPKDIEIPIPNEKKSKSYAQFILTEKDSVIFERIHYFVYPKDLELFPVVLNPKIIFNNGKYILDFESDVLVKEVYIESSEEGELSDNFFDILPNVKKTVIFTPSIKSEKNKNIRFKYLMLNR